MLNGLVRKLLSGLTVTRKTASLDRASKLLGSNRLEEAESMLRAVCIANPDAFEPRYFLGYTLFRRKNFGAADALLEQAIERSPSSHDAQYMLGRVRIEQREFEEAIVALRRATELAPSWAPAWLSLADALAALGRLDAAEDHYLYALRLAPELAQIHYDYANLLLQLGRVDEAIAHYRTALELKPGFKGAETNFIYALNFTDAWSPDDVFRAHRAWAERYAEPITSAARPHTRITRTNQRLRVGYVSANFRDHAVTWFFEPVLRHHDATGFAVYCYSDVRVPDARTERLRRYPCIWRDTAKLDDEELAQLVRDDRVDILVDLTGHTQGDRLPAFARCPAPLQITWNGYVNTTGMSAIDYRITDVYADPPGKTEHFHTERLLRMPEIFEPFEIPADDLPVGPLPALERGYVTFGSFNTAAKITPRMLALWSSILYDLPSARLLMIAMPEGRTHERIRATFAQHGIDAGRIEIRGRLSHSAFMAAHREVDIALDTFPFNGCTTTSHALWMGVPVVTLAGRTHVTRVGFSMVSNVGLARLAATTGEQYVSIATDLARNLSQLEHVRATLRARMQSSPNMDGARFTRFLENAYRRIWADHCRDARDGASRSSFLSTTDIDAANPQA
jgi:protein O-GlcNAc transferase